SPPGRRCSSGCWRPRWAELAPAQARRRAKPLDHAATENCRVSVKAQHLAIENIDKYSRTARDVEEPTRCLALDRAAVKCLCISVHRRGGLASPGQGRAAQAPWHVDRSNRRPVKYIDLYLSKQELGNARVPTETTRQKGQQFALRTLTQDRL